jgi:predicted nucleotidyltransferase
MVGVENQSLLPGESKAMLARDIIVERIQGALPHLADQYGVKRIALFGSFTSGTATDGSDVDLVVEFQRPIGFAFLDLVEYLEQLLDSKVDLLTTDGLQGIRVPDVAQSIEESLVYVEAL